MIHCAHCGNEHPTGSLLIRPKAADDSPALPDDDPRVLEQVERIAHGSTPQREYDEQGRFQPWIRRDVA